MHGQKQLAMSFPTSPLMSNFDHGKAPKTLAKAVTLAKFLK